VTKQQRAIIEKILKGYGVSPADCALVRRVLVEVSRGNTKL